MISLLLDGIVMCLYTDCLPQEPLGSNNNWMGPIPISQLPLESKFSVWCNESFYYLLANTSNADVFRQYQNQGQHWRQTHIFYGKVPCCKKFKDSKIEKKNRQANKKRQEKEKEKS